MPQSTVDPVRIPDHERFDLAHPRSPGERRPEGGPETVPGEPVGDSGRRGGVPERLSGLDHVDAARRILGRHGHRIGEEYRPGGGRVQLHPRVGCRPLREHRVSLRHDRRAAAGDHPVEHLSGGRRDLHPTHLPLGQHRHRGPQRLRSRPQHLDLRGRSEDRRVRYPGPDRITHHQPRRGERRGPRRLVDPGVTGSDDHRGRREGVEDRLERDLHVLGHLSETYGGVRHPDVRQRLPRDRAGGHVRGGDRFHVEGVTTVGMLRQDSDVLDDVGLGCHADPRLSPAEAGDARPRQPGDHQSHHEHGREDRRPHEDDPPGRRIVVLRRCAVPGHR